MRIFALALLSTSALVVVACGGAQAEDSTPGTAPSASPSASSSVARTTPSATATVTATASPTEQATETPTEQRAAATATPTTASNAPATQAPPTATPTELPPTPTPTEPPASLIAQVTVVNDSAFSPNRLTIGAGGTVTWAWSGDVMHNVASTSAGFASDFAKASTYSFTFNSPGTYYYVCEVHPTSMKGVVQVQ